MSDPTSDNQAAGEKRKKGGDLDIFLVCAPGLEAVLADEARSNGFKKAEAVAGGVAVRGDWSEAWRANLVLRGPSRVLVRIATFKTPRLDDLQPRAARVPWRAVLRREVPFTVEATCRQSRIYHTGAAAERVATAIKAATGAPHDETGAAVTILARIEDDVCTLSVDTSGALLHKRGFKQGVAKAPLRETMAALVLRACGYRGKETVVDPMCGAGTFVIEAAEIAARLNPGRARAFAFEQLATFDAAAWAGMRAEDRATAPAHTFHGSDIDAGAVRMAAENAARAGVAAWTRFEVARVEDCAPPEGAVPGLVICNPPYGARIGEARALAPLYRAFGQVVATRFAGWRVGLITTDDALAAATRLPFGEPSAPIAHGGLKVRLWRVG